MEIQKFNNNVLNCSVDCVVVDNNVWFRGKDVATAIGYKDTTHAIINNVEIEDKQKLEKLVKESESLTGYHAKISVYINESGLYALILNSHKPEAKQFKHWVTIEVLPSLRKTGWNL